MTEEKSPTVKVPTVNLDIPLTHLTLHTVWVVYSKGFDGEFLVEGVFTRLEGAFKDLCGSMDNTIDNVAWTTRAQSDGGLSFEGIRQFGEKGNEIIRIEAHRIQDT